MDLVERETRMKRRERSTLQYPKLIYKILPYLEEGNKPNKQASKKHCKKQSGNKRKIHNNKKVTKKQSNKRLET